MAASSRTGTAKPSAKSKGKQPATTPRTSSWPMCAAAVASHAAVASFMRDADLGAEVEVEEDIKASLPQDIHKAHAHVLVCAAIRHWGWLKTQTMYICVHAAVMSTVTAVSDISGFVERSGQWLNDYVESQAPASTSQKRVCTSTGSEASTSK
ncbi:hypothetical protein K488DRAFT_73972 [Vararia minispora EC-137]|uniref:Uncharacterized protein n=1 Tax=Vararia minispora EC-137 TaxID=1314806 RepID=A0ACB8Q8X8_9AGAM|nr:hypothetical protein K488DRAFT_73972 [Vararia minispora EC-137]